MTDYGVYIYCHCCQKSFHCTDGNPFCSDRCEDEWESRQGSDEEEED
jgi:hypothetical protein